MSETFHSPLREAPQPLIATHSHRAPYPPSFAPQQTCCHRASSPYVWCTPSYPTRHAQKTCLEYPVIATHHKRTNGRNGRPREQPGIAAIRTGALLFSLFLGVDGVRQPISCLTISTSTLILRHGKCLIRSSYLCPRSNLSCWFQDYRKDGRLRTDGAWVESSQGRGTYCAYHYH